jgi:cytochrome c oxidase cbb3-type subunit I
MLRLVNRSNSAALAFIVAGAFWFVYATLEGLVTAIHLVSPEFFNNMAFFVFGRARPVHVNTIVYGFIVSTLLGCALYYVPALLKVRLWSEKLGWVSFLFWHAAVVSGPICFAMGITQGREYAEYTWPFDVCIMMALLTLIFNAVMTVVTRVEKSLYVSVWYVFGTLLWTAGVYPIGNVMWHPATGAMPGILDEIFLWFYGHNLVGLLITPLAIGAAYFVVPRVTRTPLYSHTLSLVGFFSLVAIYTHIGGHHLLQAPIPNWLKTISVVDSVAMVVPVFTVLANIWLTARGKFGLLWNDVPGRFVILGSMWYLVTCVQGPMQSLPSVQQITHFTNWTIGHAHIAVLGFAGFIAIGTVWHILPLMVRRRIYSERLLRLQFGLVLIGISGFFVVLTIAGLLQGHAWRIGTGVYNVLPELAPYMIWRALLGLTIIASAFIGFFNLVMTCLKGEPLGDAYEQEVEPL